MIWGFDDLSIACSAQKNHLCEKKYLNRNLLKPDFQTLRNFFLIVLFLLIASFDSSAQEISAKASSVKSEYLIGDKIEVVLDVKMPMNFNVSWIKNDPDPQHLEPVDSFKRDSSDVNNVINYKYHLQLASYDSGKAIYPAQSFIFHKKGDTTSFRINTEPLVFNIKIISVDIKKDIKPILEPVEPGMDFLKFAEYLILGLLIIGIILSSYFMWRKKRDKKRFSFSNLPQVIRPPWEYAIERLTALQQSNLIATGEIKPYYIALSDIMRHYITDISKVDALELTTDELIKQLNVKLLQQEIIDQISFLLSLSDSVKFAKYTPDQSDNTGAMGRAFELVKALREITEKPQSILSDSNS